MSDSDIDGGCKSAVSTASHSSSADCHLCLKRGANKRFQGVCLHRACLAGVRCHNRLLTDKPRRLAKLQDMMIEDPPRWRKLIMPLADTSGSGRDKAHLLVLKNRYKQDIVEEYDLQEVVDENPLANLVVYKEAFMKEIESDEDCPSSDEIADEFKVKLARQHMNPKLILKDDAGQFLLKMDKGKCFLRSIRGHGARKQDISELGGMNAKPETNPPSRSSPITSTAKSDAGSHVSESRSSKTKRTLASASDNEVAADTPRPHADEAGTQVVDDRGDTEPPKKLKKGFSTMALEGKILSGVEFLQAKVVKAHPN